ncbi:MAG TPA: apolipoprotein N-acyltransferase [Nitrospirae bacterium]|nr:apolipoprotein N-acyltransferase [Nitrospirota bacterium]
MSKKKDISLAILSGALLVLGFPPFELFPAAWIAIVPLLICLGGKGLKSAFFYGTITGFVYFIGTIYWVFNSVYFYGGLPVLLSLLAVVLLCLFYSVFIGIFALLFRFLSAHSRIPAAFIVPVLWVIVEYARTHIVIMGFPWSSLAYTHYKILPLIQIADITGVYGISFLIAAVNGAVFDVAVHWPKRANRMPLYDKWPIIGGVSFVSVIIAVSLVYGMWRLNVDEQGQIVRVSVIQGNFEQDKKWDPAYQREIIDTYKRLTLDVSAANPDLIVWPESALPFVFGRDEPFTSELLEFQKTIDAHLLFGSVAYKGISDGRYQLTNSAVLTSPSGEVLSTYDKMHLVPFGEYVPLRKMLPFIGKLVEAVGDFEKGEEYTVMATPKVRISSPICFEIIFPSLVRKFARNGADLIVTITNDAWFGRSPAPYQHFSMAVFRAVENRMPVVMSANTGISGFIDAKGRIIKTSDLFVEAVLTEDVIIKSFQRSFYSAYGDLFVFLCIISCVLMMANNIKPGEKDNKSNFSRNSFGRNW